MGVALPRPFGWSGMLDKILNKILDHSLLDAKGIMKKYSSILKWRGPATPLVIRYLRHFLETSYN